MLGVHVRLPLLARLPIFEKEEVSWVFIVLVHVVLKAAIFGERGRDQFGEFTLYQFDLITLGFDIGHDC